VDIGDTGVEGTSRIAARADHQHALLVPSGDPGAETFGAGAARGASATPARADHTHAMDALPLAAAPPGAVVATVNGATGVSTSLARADHTHTFTPTAPWAGGWKNAAAAGIPSDAVPRIIPLTATADTMTGAAGTALVSGRVVVPAAGVYAGYAAASFAADPDGQRLTGVGINDVIQPANSALDDAPGGAHSAVQLIPIQNHLAANDTVSIWCWQTSGTVLNPQIYLFLHLVIRD
jgi:hypothetical protein